MRIATIGAMLTICLTTASHAQTTNPQRIGSWKVGEISRGEPVCRMERSYSNGTTIGVDVFIRSRMIEISVSNEDWQSLNDIPNDDGDSQGSVVTSVSYSPGKTGWKGRAKIRRSSALNREPGIYIKRSVGELSGVLEEMHDAITVEIKADEVVALAADLGDFGLALNFLKTQCVSRYSYRPENDPFRR